MCLQSYEYFHSKIAAQSCLNRADRLVYGDTILALGSMVRSWPNPVLSNLEGFPHPSVYIGQEGTRIGQAGETRYKLTRALSISDHHIRR